jgi:hypothetical protein
MRFLLVFVLCFISVFAVAQLPMSIGGPQGITVTRINAQDWMAVPIMADTPVAPLTGTGWPGRGYIVFVARPDSSCAPLPATCPPRDTSLWEYTGQRWKRVGMDYLTRLVFGGQVTQTQAARRNFIIDPYSAFINGSFYRRVSPTFLTSAQKTADSTSRIDVIVITRTGPVIRTGVPNVRPNKPLVNGDEIELTTIFFPANDTVPSATSSTNFVSSIFRIAGRDSIYYTQNNQTYAIKDSIGISRNDTASMLNPYKFTAANGLTKDSTVFRLGGSLNQNTNINLNTRRLTLIGGSDTTRFFANGSVNIGGAATDSTYKLNVNGNTRVTGYLDLQPSFNNNTAVIRNQASNDGSIMFVGQGSVVSSTPPARNVIIDPITRNYSSLTGFGNTLIGRSTGSTLTSGNQNVFIGLNAGNGVTTGTNNVIILNDNGSYSQSNVSSSIIISPGVTDSALFGLTNRYSFIGGGSIAGGDDISDFYFGIGHRTQRPQFSHINFYAPSAWSSKADTIGSNFTINAGRGTGQGLGGSVIFRTSDTTTSGTTLQTLTERARISPRGNLLVGTSSDSTFRLNVSGRARISDTLTLSTTPVTADTSANDLLVINSSNGQVRRFTGAFPVSNPTLQQVTTAGNSTSDSIVFINSLGEYGKIGYIPSGPPNGRTSFINIGTNFTSQYIRINSGSINHNVYNTGQKINYLPDTTGTLASGVRLNQNTIMSSQNGIVNIGDLWLSGSATLDFPDTGHGTSADLTITVTGADIGDVVALGIPNASIVANGSFIAWVSATNTVTVRFNNYASSGSSDPASGTFKVKVLK